MIYGRKSTNHPLIIQGCHKASNLPFVNNTISAKYNKVKHNKMRYACIANEALMKCRISFKKLQHAA